MRLILLALLCACTEPDKADSGTESPAPADTATESEPDPEPEDTGPSTPAIDADEDGFGDDVDCDDTNPNIHPDAEEVCDLFDNDCDGLVDDADDSINPESQSLWYGDADDDGYGNIDYESRACTAPDGHVSDMGGQFDCDDSDPAYNPGAPETDCADPNDYNCDGSVGFLDVDGDGFAACADCHDNDASIHPGAAEVCDHVDNDCNGQTDDEDHGLDASTRSTFHADSDGDGWGDEDTTVSACFAPEGAVEPADEFDCNDEDEAVHPHADELCDDIDNDCDGAIDDEDSDVDDGAIWYIDHDGDGHGSTDYSIAACDMPEGYTVSSDDCNDLRSDIRPGAAEMCDDIDNDCNDLIDDGLDVETYYADTDGDGYGDIAFPMTDCAAPSGYVLDATDCDDDAERRHPGAIEECGDGIDNDCNLVSDCDEASCKTGFAGCWECGDSIIDPDETCDDGNTVTEECDYGLTDCTVCDEDCFETAGATHTCGDSVLDAPEECDDGNTVTEECDYGVTSCTVCAEDCTTVAGITHTCGDSVRDPSEECDDGNTDSGDGCSSTCGIEVIIDTSGLETSWSSEARTVYVFKSNSTEPLSNYNTFCEERGMAWYTPDSAADAQNTITTLADRDGHHTWIITKNNTTLGSATWGGYSVTVNDPSCVNDSSSGFSAIRRWSCSMCDPESHGTTRCWDSGHVYDWLVCEDA